MILTATRFLFVGVLLVLSARTSAAAERPTGKASFSQAELAAIAHFKAVIHPV